MTNLIFMKKNFAILMSVIATTVILNSCETVKDLNTVDFDATFSGNLDCTTAGGGKSTLDNPVFGGSVEIVPTEDPNVNLYLNNIQKYEIESVKATIMSMSQENVTIISADLNIHNFQYDAIWSFENELLTTGKTIAFGNENGQWDTVSSILKDGQEFTIILTGEADFTAVTFTVKVEIETKVEANVL